jgi:hypothetical protein
MSPAFSISDQKLGADGREIGVRGADGALVAVITRPCAGADWFLYRFGQYGRERFKTRKAAIEAATK